LYLNEDLAETIALAHDLGHTPFGHPGESAMNELMADHGGFDHNDQALRVLELLERKYPDYDGLNLTWEVRAGLVKHRGDASITEIDGVPLTISPSLESQSADLADDLTYYGHDVDDGLEAELLDEEMLRTNAIWNLAVEKARGRGLEIKDGDEKSRGYIVRCLIDMMVENAVLTSEGNLKRLGIQNKDQACGLAERVVSFDSEFLEMTNDLRNFLFENLYYHPDIAKVNQGAVEKMRTLFSAYVKHPEWMGRTACARIADCGLHRVVADYIAGMTDRFALLEYERRCG
jgi:dGTPase